LWGGRRKEEKEREKKKGMLMTCASPIKRGHDTNLATKWLVKFNPGKALHVPPKVRRHLPQAYTYNVRANSFLKFNIIYSIKIQ
jgi:dUTPase